MDRRDFVRTISAAAAAGDLLAREIASASKPKSGIDRRARVDRHAPVVHAVDPFAPLSVGNGHFAFTADVTGLQTFAESYRDIPLATQAEWGWHTAPNTGGYTLDDAMEEYDARVGEGRTRSVPYASEQSGPAGAWLRENPHRISLARVGLALRLPNGDVATPSDVRGIVQRLDLWTGTLDSRFEFAGARLRVLTRVHPTRDAIAVRVESNHHLDARRVAVRVAFPYAAAIHTGDPADWEHPERHRTDVVRRDRNAVEWRRTLDPRSGPGQTPDGYRARAAWHGAGLRQESEHAFVVEPASRTSNMELVVEFAPNGDGAASLNAPNVATVPNASTADAWRDAWRDAPPSVRDVARAAEQHWQRFWEDGGVLDLSASTDPRAKELERRVVLSEYLTAIQCAGTRPPQETGETFNSWFGKMHLEMHWWHAAHFALWDRAALLERSLPWYRSILPVARETARMQGYTGARWPKMVGPQGRESPSGIGVFLVWQQPHVIYLSELVRRAAPSQMQASVVDAYRDLVFETAEFMTSYPWYDAARARYVLGPPLIPAQESHPPRTTYNPTFELAYWAFALDTAQRWREMSGLAREPRWDRVLRALSPLPTRDGLYVNAESAPTTWTDRAQRRDHPSLLGALGFVPPTRWQPVDRETMRRTLRRALESWQWPDTWGWDYPLVAMTAARLNEPELAVDALLMETPKNRYLPNGHNYQRPGLTIYLPGNGGVLAATATMAVAAEFPRSWNARWERLRGLP